MITPPKYFAFTFALSCLLPTVIAFSSNSGSGDVVRASTGNRPSLHPIVINCISDALRCRSLAHLTAGNDGTIPTLDVEQKGVKPIDIAMAASQIATDALANREIACKADESSDLDKFVEAEYQVIAGRVVGVVMRIPDLESTLRSKVRSAPWVKKYKDYSSFGVIEAECDGDGNDVLSGELKDSCLTCLKDDPLLRMNRAECLLAIFLDEVEKPKLELLGESLPGGCDVDFMSSDRLEVLRGSFQ
mmetsp:Transcript_35501/g.42803  ORF Transcript_35501/g.42803 Transcript_35501/m.42803 type:complete len:246 (-) Transcript_35501:37-774(-)